MSWMWSYPTVETMCAPTARPQHRLLAQWSATRRVNTQSHINAHVYTARTPNEARKQF
jgi:hypothetical protein